MNNFSLIVGRHAIEEALSKNLTFEKIFIARSIKGPFEKFIRQSAREQNIPLSYVENSKLNKLSNSNHQGAVAYVTSVLYYKYEDLIPHLIEKEGNPLVVIADGITDVRNIGAIARSCEVLGGSALMLPLERTALINEFAIKSSAGAMLHLPLCRTHSLMNAVDYLLASGFEVIGLDGKGEGEIGEYQHAGGPLALILGDEELGIRLPLRQKCRALYRIPQVGKTESLNVSVAAGIALYQLQQMRKL